jgi:hypothetical protein
MYIYIYTKYIICPLIYENPQLYMPCAGLALQDSVFVGVMPQNLEKKKCKMAQSLGGI